MATRSLTTGLPPALAPWAASLSLFPRDLALDLGAIVRRLAALIGETTSSRSDEGDPDGFAGLTRRGSYERLLHSEWLLADELPEEFARRAVMNEHLFVELARMHRVQHPLAVALFDCGPSQLGAPRIVHIAALIVLARRAASSHATFRWGVLQQPGAFFDDVSPASIRRFLYAHTQDEPSATDLDAWQDVLAAEDSSVGELWFVGSKRLTRFEAVRSRWHLEVEDVLVPEARQVGATMRHRTRTEPPVILDLPAPHSCVRLLRDPFMAESAPPTSVGSSMRFASNLLFGHGGRALLARAAGGDLIVQPYANSARPRAQKSLPPPRQIAVPEQVLLAAAGWHRGKEPLYILAAEDGIYVRRGTSSSSFFPAAPQQPIFGSREQPADLQPCFPVSTRGENGVMFLDAAQNLWMTSGERQLEQMAASVFAVRIDRGGPRVIRKAGDSWAVLRPLAAMDERLIQDAGSGAFFGFGAPDADAEHGLFAVELRNGQWVTVSSAGDRIVVPPPGCQVAGVVASSLMHGVPSLICLEADRRTISLVGHGIVTLGRAAGNVVHLAANPMAPQIAWVLESGEAEVFSLKNGQRMFRSVIQEAS
jgi:hypothetical protein